MEAAGIVIDIGPLDPLPGATYRRSNEASSAIDRGDPSAPAAGRK